MTSWRSYSDLHDLWEVKISKCQFLLHWCLDRGSLGQGFQNNISFGLWLLRGHLVTSKWSLWGQNNKVTIFASWVSGYMFFGSGISKIALVLDYDLLEATYRPSNDLWKVKIIRYQLLFPWCQNIGFLGQGFWK